MQPAAAARVVVTKTSDTAAGSALSTEPPLKPNQPSQSRKTPIVDSGMLCPRMGLISPLWYLPLARPQHYDCGKS